MGYNRLETRDTFNVLLYSLLTLGVYLMFWYAWIYRDLEEIADETPTGNSYWIDFFLNIITCGIYGIYVDYRISIILHRVWKERGMENPDDDAWLITLLDVLSFMNCYITSFYSSSLQQGKLNKIIEHMEGGTPAPGSAPGPGPSPSPSPSPEPRSSGDAFGTDISDGSLKPGKDDNPYG